MPSILLSDNGVSSGSAGLKSTAASDGALALQTTTAGGTATTAVTIDTSQNVGIGTSSPSGKLHVAGGASNVQFYLSNNSYSSYYYQNTGGSSGVSFPASQAYIWDSGGTERMRLDTSGNLGLGVTPSAWASDWKVMQIGSRSAFAQYNVNASAFVSNNVYFAGTGGSSPTYINTAAASFYQQVNGAHNWQTAASGTAGGTVTFTQAMTLDASGNLGVGTTGQTSRISATGSSSTDFYALTLRNSSGTTSSTAVLTFEASSGTQGDAASSVAYIKGVRTGAGTTGDLAFWTTNGGTPAERARIDSSGNLLVGVTSSTDIAGTSNNGWMLKANQIQHTASGTNMYLTKSVSGSQTFISFYSQASAVGSITTNGSTTSFVTTSDYRLKNDPQPMQGALAKVAQLKPCTYTWKLDGSDGQGFIAHELQAVVPDAVFGEKDAVDTEGNPVYQGIDTSFLVATLTAAIQEQQAIIEQLKARLDAANL